jgi:hypothetical protein
MKTLKSLAILALTAVSLHASELCVDSYDGSPGRSAYPGMFKFLSAMVQQDCPFSDANMKQMQEAASYAYYDPASSPELKQQAFDMLDKLRLNLLECFREAS